MKKLLFVYNAKSGKAQIRKYLADIIDVFIKGGYSVETYQTQSPCDGMHYVRKRGKDFDRIVCSGGDGTLNEIMTGVMSSDWYDEKKIPIGYIPSGSTNDFATSILLPKNMVSAANVAVYGKKKAVDIGSFNEKNFVYVAAFGVFTKCSYSTPQELKNILGHQAYVVEGVKQFIPEVTHTYHIKLVANGKKLEGDFIYGMVSNSNSVGGFKGIAGKDVGLDDGLFEVTLIRKPSSPIDLQEIISALLLGKRSKFVCQFKTSLLKVYSDDKIDWVVDGEFGGSVKKVVVRNHCRAVNVITGDNLICKKSN